MILEQKIAEAGVESTVNWKIATSPTVLNSIHDKDINIAIYERDISALTNDINSLLEQNIEFRSSGSISTIMNAIMEVPELSKCSLVVQDIKKLLSYFQEVGNVTTFRLMLATIETNMCRKFHSDINDLRMLCTYSGPGTLWLTDDNVNVKALGSRSDNKCIVLDESKVQQAKTAAVVLLKGAIYPHEETKAVIHRSPSIEENGEKRLLLRIDTNETLNLWA